MFACLRGLELGGGVRVQLERVALRGERGGEAATRDEQLTVLGVELLREREREQREQRKRKRERESREQRDKMASIQN